MKREKRKESHFRNYPIDFFIHLDKPLDGAKGTLLIKFTKDYS